MQSSSPCGALIEDIAGPTAKYDGSNPSGVTFIRPAVMLLDGDPDRFLSFLGRASDGAAADSRSCLDGRVLPVSLHGWRLLLTSFSPPF